MVTYLWTVVSSPKADNVSDAGHHREHVIKLEENPEHEHCPREGNRPGVPGTNRISGRTDALGELQILREL